MQTTATVIFQPASPLERFMRGQECPECGNTDEGALGDRIYDNGCEGYAVTWLCEACGNQWSPEGTADAHGDEGWDVFERVYGVTVLEDRIVDMPRREYERNLEPL